MTDCSNAEIRDMLPDYVNDALSANDAAIVESHVATCGDCSDEIELLRAVVAVRPRAVSVDIAKIVANLPKPQTSVGAVDSSVRAISSARSVSSKKSVFAQWRGVAAAAVAVIAIGGTSLLVARRNPASSTVAVEQTSRVALPDTAKIIASLPESISTPVETASIKRTAASGKDNALSVGELNDFSDDEIEAVMKRLEKWDGATAADPLPGVPLLPANSGGVK